MPGSPTGPPLLAIDFAMLNRQADTTAEGRTLLITGPTGRTAMITSCGISPSGTVQTISEMLGRAGIAITYHVNGPYKATTMYGPGARRLMLPFHAGAINAEWQPEPG